MGSEGFLRPLRQEDLEQVLVWRNHPTVRRYMYTQHEIKIEEHIAWFERAQHQSHRHLLIYEQRNQPVGFVNLTTVDEYSKRADWGFYLAPTAVRGTGQALGKAAIEYAFKNMSMHKLCGEALAFNERSISFHLRLGFSQEGRWRDHHYDGNSYHDVVAFGLLSPEWQNL